MSEIHAGRENVTDKRTDVPIGRWLCDGGACVAIQLACVTVIILYLQHHPNAAVTQVLDIQALLLL